jgi:hypothetical protein
MPKFKIQKSQLKEILRFYKKEHALNYSKMKYDELLNTVINLELEKHIQYYEELNRNNYEEKRKKYSLKEVDEVMAHWDKIQEPKKVKAVVQPVSRKPSRFGSKVKTPKPKRKRIAPTLVTSPKKATKATDKKEPNSSKRRVEEVVAKWDKIHKDEAKAKARKKKKS